MPYIMGSIIWLEALQLSHSTAVSYNNPKFAICRQNSLLIDIMASVFNRLSFETIFFRFDSIFVSTPNLFRSEQMFREKKWMTVGWEEKEKKHESAGSKNNKKMVSN